MLKKAQNFQGIENRNYSGIDELWDNERYLPNYNKSIISLIESALAPARNVLEFGAGIGTLAQLWFSLTGVRPDCLEIDPRLQNVLLERGFVCHRSIDSIDRKLPAIYTSNVLEHIEDDLGALKTMHELLDDDSKLVIYVPAFMAIYSALDFHVGHFRRYGKAELMRKLRQANFEVIKCHYVDSLGFIAWAFIKFRGYSPREKSKSIKRLKFYDRFLYPFSRFLDEIGFKYLFGKNIFVVAKKLNVISD